MKDHYSASPLLFYITQCRSKSTQSKLTARIDTFLGYSKVRDNIYSKSSGVSFEELRVRNSTKEELSVSNI
ncbi:hypothetical protein Bca101_024424 [Brassica carinata]